MMRRLLSILLLFLLATTLSGSAQARTATTGNEIALVAIEIHTPDDLERFEATRLPAYTRLYNPKLQVTLLSGADASGQALLHEAGLTIRILDADMEGASYYLASSTGSIPRRAIEWGAYGQPLLEDGAQVLLSSTAQQAEYLSQAGVELRRLTFDPKPLRPSSTPMVLRQEIEPDPLIQSMIDQVDSDTVDDYTAGLTGDQAVWVGGEWYTITTRHTYSGVSIQKATQWTGEHFANLGLEVEYHQWEGLTYPNVIGELPGLTDPEDIFIIGGHLDDVSGTPGADDNASGSVATMIAADILTQYDWGCTLRFALWTGEEQWMLGSEAYAQRSYQMDENIVGYLNLDMISYNTPGSPWGIDLVYHPDIPASQQLAQLFADVVETYNLDLIPELHISLGGGSDHQSFWDYFYTAILGIEDQGDFNPYYHDPGDTRAHQDLAYYTQFVKAALGTFAHMTGCLIPNVSGNLDGTVTADNGRVPIEGAQVVAQNGDGYQFSALTDASGYYTHTLLADTYTVTASAYDYLPATVTDVVIVTDTVTTQDFALLDAPQYTVSGTVTEAGSGLPLLAQLVFEGSPVSTWTDPATGFYSAMLPEGEYTMHVSADLHEPESRAILLKKNTTEDFVLNALFYLPAIANRWP
jgi:hypothetical protein